MAGKAGRAPTVVAGQPRRRPNRGSNEKPAAAEPSEVAGQPNRPSWLDKILTPWKREMGRRKKRKEYRGKSPNNRGTRAF